MVTTGNFPLALVGNPPEQQPEPESLKGTRY